MLIGVCGGTVYWEPKMSNPNRSSHRLSNHSLVFSGLRGPLMVLRCLVECLVILVRRALQLNSRFATQAVMAIQQIPICAAAETLGPSQNEVVKVNKPDGFFFVIPIPAE